VTTLKFRFERLASAHVRAGFSCEHPSLVEYLERYAGQNERADLAACCVALAREYPRVVGYYTLSSHAVLRDELSDEQAKGLPRDDRIPTFLIGRLARDIAMKGSGLGELLLMDAFARLVIAEAPGRMLVVDPIDEHARAFFEKYGFRSLGGAAGRLFLPMSTVRKALT
jgi:predicted GNAT family N-acyltransferase